MYSKTCLKRPLKKKTKTILMTNYRLMQVKSIAECSKWSILHYFRPSLSYHLSLRSFFFYFSGRLRQVLLYFLVGLLLYKQPDLKYVVCTCMTFRSNIHCNLIWNCWKTMFLPVNNMNFRVW